MFTQYKTKTLRARSKKNVRCTSTRKETERKTENQVKDLCKSCKRDMENLTGVKEEDVLDRTNWKNDIRNHSIKRR